MISCKVFFFELVLYWVIELISKNHQPDHQSFNMKILQLILKQNKSLKTLQSLNLKNQTLLVSFVKNSSSISVCLVKVNEYVIWFIVFLNKLLRNEEMKENQIKKEIYLNIERHTLSNSFTLGHSHTNVYNILLW